MAAPKATAALSEKDPVSMSAKRIAGGRPTSRRPSEGNPSPPIVHQNVAFVKIDVEGHELSVLNGAVGLLEQSRPVFLVEAEDRHRIEATRSIFEFFEKRAYKGFFLKEGIAVPVGQFRSEELQDASALLPNGGRKTGRFYVNNFFFFPQHMDGASILNS